MFFSHKPMQKKILFGVLAAILAIFAFNLVSAYGYDYRDDYKYDGYSDYNDYRYYDYPVTHTYKTSYSNDGYGERKTVYRKTTYDYPYHPYFGNNRVYNYWSYGPREHVWSYSSDYYDYDSRTHKVSSFYSDTRHPTYHDYYYKPVYKGSYWDHRY